MALSGVSDTSEQPDTKTIRAMLADGGTSIADKAAWALCDALDAARAERDAARTDLKVVRFNRRLASARADAAEAELERERVMHRGIDPEKARYRRWWKQEKDRAEAAEARIRELEQLADPELDARWCAVWQEVCAENDVLEARAEAAEDDVNEWKSWEAKARGRAETAEARIAAALAWFARTDCTWTYRTEMARRALTEGTKP